MERKIYFCGSIRGGTQDSDVYTRLIKLLKGYGEVLTELIWCKQPGEKQKGKLQISPSTALAQLMNKDNMPYSYKWSSTGDLSSVLSKLVKSSVHNILKIFFLCVPRK